MGTIPKGISGEWFLTLSASMFFFSKGFAVWSVLSGTVIFTFVSSKEIFCLPTVSFGTFFLVFGAGMSDFTGCAVIPIGVPVSGGITSGRDMIDHQVTGIIMIQSADYIE